MSLTDSLRNTMTKLTIYYSIQNGGDGSAYPIFMDTRKLAEWDQNHLDEGWGEDCWGELDIMYDYQITIEKVLTTISYYLYKELDDWWDAEDRAEFESEFFPDGLPKFKARILGGCDRYYYVFVDDVRQYRARGWNRETKKLEISEAGLVKFQKTLDGLGHND